MQKSNAFFATAKPLKLFFLVALPGLVSMLAASLYQIAEGAFVGKQIGEAAFAAINIAMPVVFINFSFADLIGVGSSVPISVALGRKEEGRANNIFTCSVLLIFLTGLLSGVTLYFAAPFFTKIMGAEGELARMAIRYVRIYAILSPFTTVVFATDNYLRISGFVKGSMLLNILMTVLTVSFLALFLVGLGMGVEGSALSSCLSMLICAVIAFIPFLRKKAVLQFVKPKFSLLMIGEIVACGMPIFLNNIAGRVTAIIMNAALLRTGGQTAVAAYAVLMYCSGVVEPMLYGVSDAVQPAIGYNWGAKSLERVRDITKCMLAFCAFVSLLCTAVMLLFPSLLVKVFVDTQDAALMALSVHALRLFGLAFLFGWVGFAVQGFFGAIEKPLPATLLSIARAVVVPVLLIYALGFMGLDGLWLNYAATGLITAIMGLIMLFAVQKRMRRDIGKATAAEKEEEKCA